MVNEKIYIYGIHTCLSQIENNPENINKIYIKNSSLNKNLQNILDIAKQRDIIVSQCEKTSMDALILSNKHQGVVMEISKRSKGHKFSLDYYIQTQSSPLILIIDSIQDPRNLGACLRSANAAGVSHVVINKDGSAPINSLVHRTSAGAINSLPIFHVTNLSRTIKEIQKYGIWVIGLDGNTKTSLYNLSLNDSIAIVAGSEGKGIRKLIKKTCDQIVSIPMSGNIESLNVSVATAIALFESKRQREST